MEEKRPLNLRLWPSLINFLHIFCNPMLFFNSEKRLEMKSEKWKKGKIYTAKVMKLIYMDKYIYIPFTVRRMKC